MAKDDLDDFDLDDIDIPDFDGDGLTSVKADRKPIEKASKSFVDNLKYEASNASNVKRVIETALPKGYGKALGDADELIGKGGELVNVVRTELEPAKRSLKKLGRLANSRLKGILPESVTAKLDDLTEDTDAQGEQLDEQTVAINSTLTEIFGAQEEETEKRRLIDDLKENERFKTNIEALAAINRGVAKQVAYQEAISSKVQRKSLELQYKQYFIAKDQFELFSGYVKETKTQLDLVVKNTALPDFVKKQTNEAFNEAIRQRIMGAASGKVADFTRNFREKLFENITVKAKDIGGQLRDGIIGAADTAEMMDQGEDGPDITETIGSVGASLAAPTIFNAIGKSLGRLIPKGGKVEEISNRLLFASENKDQMLIETLSSLGKDKGTKNNIYVEGAPEPIITHKQLMRGELIDLNTGLPVKGLRDITGPVVDSKNRTIVSQEMYDNGLVDEASGKSFLGKMKDKVTGTAADLLNDVSPKHNPNFKIETDSDTLGQTDGIYTSLSDTVLTKVIPTLLEDILHTTEKIESGNRDLERGMYNYETGSVTRESFVVKQIKDKVVNKGIQESIGNNLDELINEIDPKGQLSPEARKALNKQLLIDAMDGDKYFNINRLMSVEGLGSIKDPVILDEVLGFLIENFMGDDGSERKDQETSDKLLKGARRFRRAQEDIPDYEADIKRLSNLYGTRVLNRTGFLKGNEGDLEYILNLLLGNDHKDYSGPLPKGEDVHIPDEVLRSLFGDENGVESTATDDTPKGSSGTPKASSTTITLKRKKGKKGKQGKDTKPKPNPLDNITNKKRKFKTTENVEPESDYIDEYEQPLDGETPPKFEGEVGDISVIHRISLPPEGYKRRLVDIGGWIYPDGTILKDNGSLEHITENKYTVEELSNGKHKPTGGSFEDGGVTENSKRVGGIDGKGGFHAILHPDEIVIDKMNPKGWIKKLFKSKPDADETDVVENINSLKEATGGVADSSNTMEQTLGKLNDTIDSFINKTKEYDIKGKITDKLDSVKVDENIKSFYVNLTDKLKNLSKVKDKSNVDDKSSVTEGLVNTDVIDEIRKTRIDIVDAINAGNYISLNSSGAVFKDFKVPGVFGKLKDKITTTTDRVLNRIKDITGKVSDIEFQDVFVRGRKEPALEALKLKLGYYVDANTGKVIESYDDITGPVKDIHGKIVISTQDILDGLFDETGKPFKSIKALQKKASTLKDAIFGVVDKAKNFMGNRLRNVGSVGSALGRLTGVLKEEVGDLYIKGQEKAIVLQKDLLAGKYIDSATGKPIFDLTKLKGDLLDVNRKVVVTLEELKNETFFDGWGKKVKLNIEGIRSFVGDTAKKVTSGIGGILGFQKNILGNVAGFVSDQYNKTLDVFVVGEDTPRLRAVIMKNGGYLDKLSGEPIYDIDDIRGPIIDLEQNEVLNMEDINKGLYTSRGRLLSKALQGVKTLASTGLGLATSVLTGGFKLAKSGLNKVKGLGKGLLGKFKGKGEALVGAGDGWGEMQTEYLNMIYDLLDERLAEPKKTRGGDTDGDGIRDGSWREKLLDKNEETKTEGKAEEDQKKRKKRKKKDDDDSEGSLLDLLGLGKAGGKLKKAGSIAAKALPAIASMGGTALSVGGSILSGLGTGIAAIGSGIATVVSAPVLVGAAVVAAVAVGGYLAYKYLYKAPKGPIHKYRLAQYGTLPDNKDNLARLSALEKLLYEQVQFTELGPEISNVTDQELHEMWGVAVDDETKVNEFNTWFQNRFKPIFLLHASAINKYSPGLDILDVDSKLPKELKAAYLTLTKFPMGGDTPYSVRVNPFDGDEPLTGPKEITQFYEEALEKFKEKAKEGSVAEAAQANLDKLSKGDVEDAKVDKEPTAKASAEAKVEKPVKKTDKLTAKTDTFTKNNTLVVLPYSGSVSALMAVRMKAYGLTEMDATKVGQLVFLERAILNELTVKNRYVTFNGDVEEMFERYGSIFQATKEDKLRYENWMTWFIYRFMAVLTNYVNMALKINEKINLLSIDNTLTPQQQYIVAVDVYQTMNSNGLSVFNVTNSPWDKYKLNGAAKTTLDNIFALEAAIKDGTTLPEESVVNKPKSSGSVDRQAQTIETKENLDSVSSTDGGNLVYKEVSKTTFGSKEKFLNDTVEPATPEAGGIEDLPPLEAIKKSSKLTGVDENILTTFAKLESGLDPNAKASTSSATGLFQFTDGTWKDIVNKTGRQYGVELDTDRRNATANALMGGEYLKANYKYVEGYEEANIPLKVALYLAHFLGPGGARKFIRIHRKNPNSPIEDAVSGAAINANKSLLAGKTTSTFIQHLLSKFNRAEGTPVAAYGVPEPKGETESLDSIDTPNNKDVKIDTSSMLADNTEAVAPSFEGGGITPNGPRVGGVDGKGGFHAVLHPSEIVLDRFDADGTIKREDELLKDYKEKEAQSRIDDTDMLPSFMSGVRRVMNPVGAAMNTVASYMSRKEDEKAKKLSVLENHEAMTRQAEASAMQAKQEAMRMQELKTLGSMDGTLRNSLMVQQEIRELLLKVVEQNENRVSNNPNVEQATETVNNAANINYNQGDVKQTKLTPNFNMSR